MSYHLDIAKERFLDLISNGVPADFAASEAISNADTFAAEYKKWESKNTKPDLIGCRACYGSGGKRHQPCKVCNGSGKVQP